MRKWDNGDASRDAITYVLNGTPAIHNSVRKAQGSSN